jgi:hypothetical protein
VQEAELTVTDGIHFGWSVSVSGDTALVGAPTTNSGDGAVYVFTRSGSSWTQQAKLTATDGVAFGCSVSLYGDTALIGADVSNSYIGAAYVFTRSGSSWTQQAKLTASDGVVWDLFGHSVSLYGDTALIGAYGWAAVPGKAYIFTRSGSSWTQQATLTATDGVAGDGFGFSVSLSGDTALIGAVGWNSVQGAAYVFTRSGSSWMQQAKLMASDGAPFDEFGWSVSLSGETALIGAPFYNNGKGATYVLIDWTSQAKLTASDAVINDEFGFSVSLSADTAFIGAPGCGSNKGAAYVFVETRPPSTPTVWGPTTGEVGITYTYSFTSTDPMDGNIFYQVDWDDGTMSGWIGSYSSGAIVSLSHSWTTRNTYTIRVQAKDIYGHASGYGMLSVSIPRDKAISNSFLNLLQSHPSLDLLFQKLIQYIGD